MLYGQSEVCTFLETDTGANRPNIFQMAKKQYHLKLKKMTYRLKEAKSPASMKNWNGFTHSF